MGVPTLPKRDDTFLLYYLEDFAEYEADNCPSLFCLSPSTVQIILSALRFCVWPTRWRENRDDNNRKIAEGLWPDARKWGELSIQEVTYNMACDIEEGFNTLGQAIENASPKVALEHMAQAMMALARAQCCRGGLGDGTNNGIPTTWTDSDGITHPIYGDNPPITHDGETPPEGFETWADYLTNKCQVANLVFDGWLATMRNMSTFTVFNATALGSLLGLALAGIIAFPPAAIPVMIGLLLGLGSFVVMFSQIADNLEANRESIVCDLYQSETVEVMTAILADALDAAIGILQVAPGVGQMFKASALLLVNGDTLNQLMSGIAGVSYPDADCSTCDDVCTPTLSFIFGSGDLTLNGEVRTLTSELFPGNGVHYIRIENTSDPCCQVYLEQVSWAGELQPVWEMNQFTCGMGIVWEQNWFFGTAPAGANIFGNFEYPGYISMGANSPFTIDVILDTAH